LQAHVTIFCIFRHIARQPHRNTEA